MNLQTALHKLPSEAYILRANTLVQTVLRKKEKARITKKYCLIIKIRLCSVNGRSDRKIACFSFNFQLQEEIVHRHAGHRIIYSPSETRSN